MIRLAWYMLYDGGFFCEWTSPKVMAEHGQFGVARWRMGVVVALDPVLKGYSCGSRGFREDFDGCHHRQGATFARAEPQRSEPTM